MELWPPSRPREYLIRFVQVHETFRRPEIESLATLAGTSVEFLLYNESSPYSIVSLQDEAAARNLIARSISSKGIYELWGSGSTYEELHADIKARTSALWPKYHTCSFKFDWDTFEGSRTLASQRPIIESFQYMDFMGPIRMKGADETFTIFEEYVYHKKEPATLKRIYLGRFLAPSSRHILDTYTLKKRQYINTTSMDSELAFLTANIALAAPGKLFYDPFVGTGSFPIACAHFGARCWGSDIDGRMIRGKGDGANHRDITTNFRQYGISDMHMDGFISDLTHSPLRGSSGGTGAGGASRWLDGIICDPPYGVREGLKVLGHKDGRDRANGDIVYLNGVAAHLQDKYIPPKKAYSLEAMLGDILAFAARMLVDGGRVSLWMPTANDAEEELAVPSHPALELVSVCVQVFNKWSRRLLTYRRRLEVDAEVGNEEGRRVEGTTADELNGFRRRYFQGFRVPTQSPRTGNVVAVQQGKNEAPLPDVDRLEINETSESEDSTNGGVPLDI